jgi:hypothetical protein
VHLLVYFFLFVCSGSFAAFPTISCETDRSLVVVEEGIDSVFVDIQGQALPNSFFSKLTKQSDSSVYQLRMSLPKVHAEKPAFALSEEEPLLFSTLELPSGLEAVWSLAPSPVSQTVKLHSFRFRSQLSRRESLTPQGTVERKDLVRFGISFAFADKPEEVLTADIDFSPSACRAGERAWSPAR